MHIGYVNVRGLSNHTHQHINSWLHSSSYDILILSETWFQGRNQYISDPFYLTESTYPENPHPNRRQDGGLLALCHPSLKNKITIFYCSRYIIGLTIYGIRIAFVYFPPSLSNVEITYELESLGYIDTLIGDMNIRLGNLTGDKLSNFPKRCQTIYNYTSSYHLDFQRNVNLDNISRTDHLFSNRNRNWEYIWDLPFVTDHGLMSFKLNDAPMIPLRNNDVDKRFNFKPFLNEFFKDNFLSLYDDLYGVHLLGLSTNLINTCCESMILPSTSDTQTLIDIAYDTIISSILDLLHQTLHSYNCQTVKTNRDPIQLASENPPSNIDDPIRQFKRSQRTMKMNNPILSSDPLKTPLEDCTGHYTNLFSSHDPPPINQRQNDTMFGLNFQWELINEITNKYPNHKSIGPDKIHILVFKTLSRSEFYQTTIQNMFQVFGTTGLMPRSWSTCNLHLLLKDPINPIPPNTRPISLSPILRRIFEKCLMRIWDNSNEKWLQLNYGQAGFRRGYNTLSQLVLSDEISQRDCKFSIFLDLKAAFDSVSWHILLETLEKRSCPPIAKSLILSLICKPANLLLSVNQSERISIPTSKGVFQGGGISALIFAIYIDPLANLLNQDCSPHRPLALLYADDIQLKPKSPEQGQFLLDVCTIFAQDHNLTWNIKKCAVVGDSNGELFLDNQIVPNLESYKYLGAIHETRRINWHATFQKSVEKQSRFLNAIQSNNWHPRLKLIIYRTFARPITEYVLVLTWLWYKRKPHERQSTLQLIKDAHRNGIRFVFGYNRHYVLMDFLSGFGTYEHRLEALHGSLVQSFKKLSISNPLVNAKSIYFLSNSEHFLLPFCFQSSYLSKFKALNLIRVQANEKKLTWKNFINRQLQALCKNTSYDKPTVAYFQPKKLLKDNGSQMFQLSRPEFQCVLSWRLNIAFPYQTCCCDEPFSRRHLSCFLQDHPIFSRVLNSDSFQVQRNSMNTIFDAQHYTVLDHLLNSLNYEDFLTLFYHLRDLLNT